MFGKLLQPGAIFYSKCTKKRLARDWARRELQCSPRNPNCIFRGQGREGREGTEGKREERSSP